MRADRASALADVIALRAQLDDARAEIAAAAVELKKQREGAQSLARSTAMIEAQTAEAKQREIAAATAEADTLRSQLREATAHSAEAAATRRRSAELEKRCKELEAQLDAQVKKKKEAHPCV